MLWDASNPTGKWAVTRVTEITNHFKAKHCSHPHALFSERLSMNRTAHAGGPKIRRLFQSERNQFHSKRRRLPAKQLRELYQSSYIACIVKDRII
jgi:hypothetical protein